MTSDIAILIRRAGPDDAAMVIAFNQAMAVESEGKTLDPPTLAAGIQAALTDSDRCAYFIAETDGSVAGQTMVTYEWSDWRNGWFWWIQSVYVVPQFRRRGVFRALHEHIRSLARDRDDVCGLRLYVDRGNAHAIETYRTLGMSLTAYRVCEEEW